MQSIAHVPKTSTVLLRSDLIKCSPFWKRVSWPGSPQKTKPTLPCLRATLSTASTSPPSQNSEINGSLVPPRPRVFVQYHVYKGKSALCLKPIKPIFRQLENGSLTMQREGSLFLEFANAVGTREYDWSNKKVFALSVAELGTILAMDSTDQSEFFHDPNKGRQGEGSVTKSFKLMPMKDGYFFSLSVREYGKKEDVTVPVSKAEFMIIRNTMNFVVPVLMGWQAFVDPSSIDSSMLEANQLHQLEGFANTNER